MKRELSLKDTEIIVKFMGLKTYKHYEQILFKETQPTLWKIDVTGRDIVSSEFHSSWDWLLPVYKKVINEDFKALAEKAKKSRKDFNNKNSLLKTIDDIGAVIRCEIWGVRIEDAYNGIVEAILFYEKYKNLDKAIVDARF